MSKHTPLPWKMAQVHFGDQEDSQPRLCAVAGERILAGPGGKRNDADVELIVRAVNAHEELVEVLRHASAAIAVLKTWVPLNQAPLVIVRTATTEHAIEAVLAKVGGK